MQIFDVDSFFSPPFPFDSVQFWLILRFCFRRLNDVYTNWLHFRSFWLRKRTVWSVLIWLNYIVGKRIDVPFTRDGLKQCDMDLLPIWSTLCVRSALGNVTYSRSGSLYCRKSELKWLMCSFELFESKQNKKYHRFFSSIHIALYYRINHIRNETKEKFAVMNEAKMTWNNQYLAMIDANV